MNTAQMAKKAGFAYLCLAGLGSVVYAQQPVRLDLPRVQWAASWLDRFARDAMAKTGVPGMAIAVVYKDQVAYLQSFGVRSVAAGGAVGPDTVFQIGNLSEPVTTTALAAIMDNGYVTWDDLVANLDPDFNLSDNYVTSQVTLRDLLTHRSGLPSGAGTLLQDLGYDQDTILSRLRELPLNSFREFRDDADFGFTEATLAAALQYGDTWENLIQAELFQPLGMRSSSTEYALHFNSLDRAALHVAIDGKMTAKYRFDTDPSGPAIGVSSTARDMAQWLMLHLNRGSVQGQPLIDPSAFAQLYLPQTFVGFSEEGQPHFYGLGWNIEYTNSGKRRVWQTGDLSRGGSSSVAMYPDDQIGIVVLTNAAPTGLSEACVRYFFDVVYNGLNFSVQASRDWLAVESNLAQERERAAAARIIDYSELPRPARALPPTLSLDRYTGIYHSEYYGDLEIRVRENGLTMSVGPLGTAYPLKHWNQDTFTYFFDGASQPPGMRGVIFALDAKNSVRFVRVDNFSAVEGNDTFQPAAAATPSGNDNARKPGRSDLIRLRHSTLLQ